MGLCLSKPHRPPSLWSDLPPELLGLILRRLLSHTDRLSFRAVCRQWRLAAQQERNLPPALPWVRLNDRIFRSLPGGELRCLKPLGLGLCRTRTAIPSHGWLSHERYQIGSFFFVNPFTFAAIFVLAEPQNDLIHKMVVCSPDLIAAMLNGDSAVGFYRPGAPSWSVSPAPSYHFDGQDWMRRYRDIAFFQGKLYALTRKEEIFSHELVDENVVDGIPKASHAVEHVIEEHAPVQSQRLCQRYLVASCDKKLLMVRWCYPLDFIGVSYVKRSIEEICDAIKLQVFEADLEMGRWTEVKDGLNGQALFISENCSRAVRLCTSDHKFQGDHVYFLGHDLGFFDTTFKSYLYGSYDLRNDRIGELFLNKKRNNKENIHTPEWFFPCMSDN